MMSSKQALKVKEYLNSKEGREAFVKRFEAAKRFIDELNRKRRVNPNKFREVITI